MNPIKLLVIDDHPLIHDAMRFLVPGLERPVEMLKAETGVEANRVLSANPDVDLILLDVNLPDINGLTLMSSLQQQAPRAAIVILSGQIDQASVRKAIAAGAMGYIPKSSRAEAMLMGLRHVLAGGIYLPTDITPAEDPVRVQREQMRRLADLGLTERQCEVLKLLLRGKPTKMICRELSIAEGTAKVHIAAIFRALNVNNRTEAVYTATKMGLVAHAA